MSQALRVAVFGLGYVGLPLVRACLDQGYSVIGFDIDSPRVSALRSGLSHVDDVSNLEIRDWLRRGFHPTDDESDLKDVDVFIICVPTPLSVAGEPDLSAVEAATRTIARRMNPKRIPLVVLESTTYPGTTGGIVKDILEGPSCVAGRDFFLAFSPERIDPGNKVWQFGDIPKVVGGFSPACTQAAAAFYGTLTSKVFVTKGLREAEMAKLLENTYRHINIALVNELWKLAYELGIDMWDVIDAASTKPYGFQEFRPGPGVGGHCIPIDPNYLSHLVQIQLGQTFRFVELAQEINSSMPDFIVKCASDQLERSHKTLSGATILLLGVTYKADVADTRESPFFPIFNKFRNSGATVKFHDPYITDIVVDGEVLVRTENFGESLNDFDLIVLLQCHSDYLGHEWGSAKNRVFDTRGCLR